MVQHGAPGLAECQQLDQLAIGTAREPVGDERRSLRSFLGRLREALEQPRRREQVEPLADGVADRLDVGEAPRENEFLGEGTDAAIARAAFTALSTKASHA